MSDLTKFQKFTVERISRATIVGLPVNPRKISAYAKKKLQANLKRVGLLEPVIFNKKTGHLVGGHQRLACLDALESSRDYMLDVAMVSLTEKQEKEQGLFLNNAAAMGEWDLALLAPMLPDLNLEQTGFDGMELELIFEGTGLFSLEAQSPEMQQALGEMGEIAATRKKAKSNPPPEEKAASAAEAYEARQRMRAEGNADASAEDTERYLVIVCDSREARERLGEALGRQRDDRYISEPQLRSYLKQA
jgi:hypothetical protein